MATADQLSRAAAPAFDYQIKVYAGGKRAWADLATIRAGDPYTPAPATVLTAAVTRASTAIAVDSATGFTTGTITIAPNGSGEQYEIIKYGSRGADSFSDLTRVYQDEFSGVHSAGASVTEWLEITDWVTGLSLSIEESDNVISWSAELAGISFNSRILDRDNAILVMWRFRPGEGGEPGAWSTWAVALVGYVKSAGITDSHRQEKAWKAVVEGLAQYLASTDAPAHQFGRTDLAAGKTVQVSSVLADPGLMANSGEYLGYPGLGGSNLVDGDITTLWISDGEPTSAPETKLANGNTINEVYLAAPPGWPALQWFEIFYKNTAGDATDSDLKYYMFVTGATQWGWPGEGRDCTWPINNFISLVGTKSRSMDKDGSFAIFCSNRARFEERWAVSGSIYVLDWRDFITGAFTLSTISGFLAMMGFGTSLETIVWYGGGGVSPFGEKDEFAGYGPDWSGVRVAVPPAGHSLRRSPCGKKTSPDVATNFLANEDAPTPGEAQDDNPEWFAVDLGALGIELDQTLLVGENEKAILTSTLGLLDSGSVMINAEIISYQSRDDAGDRILALTRGVGGTTPAEHPAGSLVKPYEGGVAYDAHLVGSVQWKRRPVQSGSTLATPKNFKILFSTVTNPIYPSDGNWDDDWEDYWDPGAVISVINHPATVTEWSGTPPGGTVRARHILFLGRDMSDGGRFRLNEFHAYAATGEVAGGSEGTTEAPYSGEVIKYLLTEFGLADSQITLTDQGIQFGALPTTKARYLQVIRDILRQTGTALHFGLDETVDHRFSPWHPWRGLPAVDITWARSNARLVRLEQPDRHNVSQVRLRAINPAGDQVFEAAYPPQPLPIGSELVIENAALGSVTEACLMAEAIFRRRNGPLRATVTPVGPAEWVRPGQRHLITWTMDTENTLLQGRNFVVQRVQYDLFFGRGDEPRRWDCTISLSEVVF